MENIIQRVKGRLPSQLRDISCEQGIITKADGSSRLIIDKSKVIVGIYGPIKANFTKDEESDKAILNVIFRKQRGQTGSSEAEKQEFIRNTFEDAIFLNLYPRMEITIDIQVLSDDGSILSCAINAVQLALLNSGISMKYTVAAISLCFKENILFLDPTLNEEQVFLFLFYIRIHKVVVLLLFLQMVKIYFVVVLHMEF